MEEKYVETLLKQIDYYSKYGFRAVLCDDDGEDFFNEVKTNWMGFEDLSEVLKSKYNIELPDIDEFHFHKVTLNADGYSIEATLLLPHSLSWWDTPFRLVTEWNNNEY